MIASLRRASAALGLTLVVLAGCSVQSPSARIHAAELDKLTSFKKAYPNLVMGFDFAGNATLIVSLDIQNYDALEDDQIAALRKAAVDAWRSAWLDSHPHGHAFLHVHMIDFIGRTIADVRTTV
jgi:hypothetical protein